MGFSFKATNLLSGDVEVALKDKWLSIEKSWPNTRCFMSWDWFSAYCTQLPKNFPFSYTEIIDENNKTVSILVFAQKEKKRLRIFNKKVLHAFRTGVELYDQVWPEYIKPLTMEYVPAKVLLDWLQFTIKEFDAEELSFNVASREIFWENLLSRNVCFQHLENGGSVTFEDGVKFANKTIKRQINQTRRFFEPMGGLSINEVGKDGFDTLLENASWHIEKWSGSDTPSGLENKSFIAVHKELFSNSKKIIPRLFTLSNEQNVIGVCYVIQDGNWAGFYMSSLKHFDSNHVHLGTWLHVNISEFLIMHGVLEYDFMAGDAKYKERLSNSTKQYGVVTVKRNSLMRWVDDSIMGLKKYLLG